MSHPIETYYDENAVYEWQRFERHRMEFALTRRALARHLPPAPARLLDCGGGPGRYAIHLTQQGYAVTLLDLAQGNLALAREKASEAGVTIEQIVHGNALDLSSFADASFDAVLLLGPLYHLLEDAQRRQAVAEAARVLKPGGLLFAGFITLYAPFRDAIAKGYLQDLVHSPAQKLLDTQIDNVGFTDAWFALPTDVPPLMASAGLRPLELIAVEGLTAGHDQHLRTVDDATFEAWVDINEGFCRDPHLLGAADHLLYIGERPA